MNVRFHFFLIVLLSLVWLSKYGASCDTTTNNSKNNEVKENEGNGKPETLEDKEQQLLDKSEVVQANMDSMDDSYQEHGGSIEEETVKANNEEAAINDATLNVPSSQQGVSGNDEYKSDTTTHANIKEPTTWTEGDESMASSTTNSISQPIQPTKHEHDNDIDRNNQSEDEEEHGLEDDLADTTSSISQPRPPRKDEHDNDFDKNNHIKDEENHGWEEELADDDDDSLNNNTSDIRPINRTLLESATEVDDDDDDPTAKQNKKDSPSSKPSYDYTTGTPSSYVDPHEQSEPEEVEILSFSTPTMGNIPSFPTPTLENIPSHAVMEGSDSDDVTQAESEGLNSAATNEGNDEVNQQSTTSSNDQEKEEEQPRIIIIDEDIAAWPTNDNEIAEEQDKEAAVVDETTTSDDDLKEEEEDEEDETRTKQPPHNDSGTVTTSDGEEDSTAAQNDHSTTVLSTYKETDEPSSNVAHAEPAGATPAQPNWNASTVQQDDDATATKQETVIQDPVVVDEKNKVVEESNEDANENAASPPHVYACGVWGRKRFGRANNLTLLRYLFEDLFLPEAAGRNESQILLEATQRFQDKNERLSSSVLLDEPPISLTNQPESGFLREGRKPTMNGKNDDAATTKKAKDEAEHEEDDDQLRRKRSANSEFVEGLDDIDKFFEDVDPPDELDIGAGGTSIQEVLMGRGSHILRKRIIMGLKKARNVALDKIQDWWQVTSNWVSELRTPDKEDLVHAFDWTWTKSKELFQAAKQSIRRIITENNDDFILDDEDLYYKKPINQEENYQDQDDAIRRLVDRTLR
ncbi:hypothetical protein ACA910_000509 [Epithemia clementina (nom. ined.)]